MSELISYFIKGIPLGISNTLPGISGGTMALVLKIYEDLINGIKNINLKVLIPIFLGAASGILFSSRLVTIYMDKYPDLVTAFLFGLILASSKITGAEIGKYNINKIILIFLGLILAGIISLGIGVQPVGGKITNYRYFIGGFTGSIAMILPGISGGTVLVLLGIYRPILAAVSALDIKILVIFAFGLILGLLTISRVLSFLLNKYRSLMMALLTGLILGSLFSVMPGKINFSVTFAFIFGFLVIELLRRYEIRKYS